jgi:hypothetical protein
VLLSTAAVALTAAGVAFHLRKLQKESVVSELRSWV